MSSDLYTKLYQGQLPASVTTFFTVPAGHNYIVKNVRIVNNDSVARTFALYRDGTTAAKLFTPPAMSIPTGGMVEWDGTQTFEAGATFGGIASVASQLTIEVSGDDYTL